MIDQIPAWFGITAGCIAALAYMVIEIHHAQRDPKDGA